MDIVDRDGMFAIMNIFTFIENWEKESKNIPPKIKTKLGTIKKLIVEILGSYGKNEGTHALEALLEESKQYKFYIARAEEQIEFSDTLDMTILKLAIKKVVNSNMECAMCEREKYTQCEWFTLQQMLYDKSCGKNCPYKKNLLGDII